jgi:pimeloyl-ACP methyl ester carboxylesterase
MPTEAPAGLAEWAGDAVALLDHLGVSRAHVAGHSLGGLIALHMAATAPARVGQLALLTSAPIRVPRTHAILRHLLSLRAEGMAPDLWLRGLFPWLFHPRLFDDPAAVDAMVAGRWPTPTHRVRPQWPASSMHSSGRWPRWPCRTRRPPRSPILARRRPPAAP